jgi:hypothetical protein
VVKIEPNKAIKQEPAHQTGENIAAAEFAAEDAKLQPVPKKVPKKKREEVADVKAARAKTAREAAEDSPGPYGDVHTAEEAAGAPPAGSSGSSGSAEAAPKLPSHPALDSRLFQSLDEATRQKLNAIPDMAISDDEDT